jgi:DNA-binding response OmpR family regulator
LAETLKSVASASPGFELVQTQDVSRVRELCAMYGPDVVLLDAMLGEIAPELRRLKDAPETAGVHFVVAQAGEDSIESFKEAGAHAVLTTTFSPISLWRATNRNRADEHNLPSPREPIGDVGLRDLCERLSRELKRGLFEAADEQSQSAVVSLGDGTEVRAAIWAAVARIREVLVGQSEGRIHFGPGPDGSVVLAPGAGLGLRGRTLADSASIDLTGRRILVADDDPAVAWFVGGTLRAAGADVREVQDGRRALSMIQHWWPELIVSDVLMPGIDGFALCHEVKRDVALRDVPIILLSWKEDLLFRLRELGADADAYIRKEASASSLVDRVRELLWPRISLERRLRIGQEVRGRLDGITPRTLIEAACRLGRHVRITLRDASAHYDVRIRDHSLRAVTRTRPNGAHVRGQSALAALLGVSAGRFSVIDDDQVPDDDFPQSDLEEVLRTPILRARAAQRVLSGPTLGTVEHVSLDPDAFADELSMLPLSLKPLVDELLRGTAPSQLLAAGATSLNSLEALLSDAARRGAVLSITGKGNEDLLTREILALSAAPSELPPPAKPVDPPLFSFQLTPSPLPAAPVESLPKAVPEAAAPATQGVAKNEAEDEFDWASEASWESNIPASTETQVQAERSSPYSRPRISAEWGGSDKRKTDEAIAADLGRTLAATAAAAKTGSIGPELSSNPVTLRSRAEQAANTPELADVVLSAASDGVSQPIAAYPLKTAHLGLAVAASPLATKLPASGAPIPIEAASHDRGPSSAVSKEAPIVAPTDVLPASTETPAGAGSQQGFVASAAPTTENAESAEVKQPIAAAPEAEAVFSLYQSASPPVRLPGISAAPVVQLEPAKEQDTLHSALASNTSGAMSSNSSEADSAEATIDAPSAALAAQPAEPLGCEYTTEAPETSSHEAQDDAADTTLGQHVAPSSVPPRRNQWLVPVSLALTAGVLSFTVALPIVKRFLAPPSAIGRSAAGAAAVATETDRTAAVETSTVAPTEAQTAPSTTAEEPLPAETNTELPPGVTVAPDKGLLMLKTPGVHSIFVDDEFVGRGPERAVTLSPGQHKVRTSLNGEEHTETVEVVAGRLIQRSLDTNGK